MGTVRGEKSKIDYCLFSRCRLKKIYQNATRIDQSTLWVESICSNRNFAFLSIPCEFMNKLYQRKFICVFNSTFRSFFFSSGNNLRTISTKCQMKRIQSSDICLPPQKSFGFQFAKMVVPMETDSTYSDVHRSFLQACSNHGLLSIPQALAILTSIRQKRM